MRATPSPEPAASPPQSTLYSAASRAAATSAAAAAARATTLASCSTALRSPAASAALQSLASGGAATPASRTHAGGVGSGSTVSDRSACDAPPSPARSPSVTTPPSEQGMGVPRTRPAAGYQEARRVRGVVIPPKPYDWGVLDGLNAGQREVGRDEGQEERGPSARTHFFEGRFTSLGTAVIGLSAREKVITCCQDSRPRHQRLVADALSDAWASRRTNCGPPRAGRGLRDGLLHHHSSPPAYLEALRSRHTGGVLRHVLLTFVSTTICRRRHHVL